MIINKDNLFIQIQKKENDSVKSFLQENSIDIEDEYSRSPLINAVISGNTDLIKWLIEKDADVNKRDTNGWTALFFAAQEADAETVRLLLEHDADPNIQDNHGNVAAFTILRKWKGGKNFDSLKEIVKHGANLKINNNYDKNPFEIIPESIKSKLNL